MAAALLLWPLVKPGRLRNFVLCLSAMAVVALAISQHRTAREWEQPIDITTTIEYKSARWLAAHMPEARVFAPGTIGFWLNAFTDNPQITGGFDNGILNAFLPHVIFQVYAGEKQRVMVDLMKAYGVDAVVAGGKDSAEFYHPISHPEKFEGMKEFWRDKGDAIYEVPRGSRSLAHTIRLADQVDLTPVGYDTLVIQPYLAAIENPAMPPASFRWLAPDRAIIRAEGLQPDHVFSVQISWDKGWRAYVQNERVHAWGDKLGQMVVEPRCTGACDVELRYDGGTEHRYASILCILALLFGPVLVMLKRYVQGLWL